MIEAGFQKLSHTIEVLISSKKFLTEALSFKILDKPLDLELEFNNRPHPFKQFEEIELPKLVNAEKTKYSKCLIESKNEPALAYFLLKNNDLSRSSRAASES